MEIIDIGIGTIPWFANAERKGLAEIFPNIPDGAMYTGVDQTETTVITGNWKHRCRNRFKKHAGSGHKLTLIECDARELTFPSSHFDLTILSDVISHPSHDWCSCGNTCCIGCNDKWFQGITDSDKWKIVEEAIRVTKSGGKLIICAYQSIDYTWRTMKAVLTHPGIRLLSDYSNVKLAPGMLDLGGGHLYGHIEKVFTKV